MSYGRSALFRIQFTVEPSSSGCTHCKTCTLKISMGVIRIVIKKYMKTSLYYHLNCFDPVVKQYIHKDDIRIKLIDNDLKIFQKWLEDWNKNYYCLDFKPITDPIPKQSLATKQVYKKRAYLEVFKFLSVKELLKTIIYVNKDFYQAAWAEELWKFFLLRDFSIKCSEGDSKQAYAENFSVACADCWMLTNIPNFIRCPNLKKNLCRKCYNKPKYRLLNQNTIKSIYGIELYKLDIETCTTDGHTKVVYSCVFEDCLSRYRKAQKERIVEMMKKLGPEHPALNDVLNIDTDHMDVDLRNRESSKAPKSPRVPKVGWSFFETIFHFIRIGKGKMTEKTLIKKIENDFNSLKN